MKNKYSKVAANDFFPQKETSNIVFNLKVSEKEKFKDEGQWFKDYMNYVVPFSSSTIDEYKELKTNYEVLNNNLSAFEKELHRFCNPLGEDIGQIEETVVPFEKLNNKVNVLLGELLKRNDNHKVLLTTAKAVKAKNQALVEAIKSSVEERVALEIQKQQEVMKGMSEEDAQGFIEQLRTQETPEDILNKNWISEWEMFYSKGLKFCNFDQDIKTKKYETFKDALAADRFFIYSGWRHGKPHFEVRNPLFIGFHKSPEESYVNKASYVWYKKPVTIDEIYDKYGTVLSTNELQKLNVFAENNTFKNRKNDVLGSNAEPIFDHINEDLFRSTDATDNKTIGSHQGNSNNGKVSRTRLVWETHFEFKAYKEVIFISYLDDYNEMLTLTVNKDFNIPENANKVQYTNKFGDEAVKYVWFDELTQKEYTAETFWIPRKYEIVRLGSDIFPVMREVPFQTTNIDNPYSDFNLSTFGGILTSRNAKSVSLVQRALPYYFQYIYIKHIQNRELSKYQGAIQSIDVDQIPDSLGQDAYGNPIKDKLSTYLLYLKRTNKDFFSGSQTSLGGAPPATRSPGSSGYILGTAVELMNLQSLLEIIDREIGLAMGISPQREAAFSSNSNVTDNKQAIIQSSHITEPYFYLHSEIWKHAFTDYLKNFRTWCEKQLEEQDECFITYALNDGTTELFKVTPKMCDILGVVLFVSNSGQDQTYLDSMMQMSHAFAQNAGEGMTSISNLIKHITQGASPEEVHQMIEIEGMKQQKRMEGMEKIKTDSQEKIAKIQSEIREDVQKHELEKIDRKGEWDVKKAATMTYFGMDDKDLDDDGRLDIEEIMNDKEINLKKIEQKDRELMLKDKQHSDKLKVEEKKIEAQERIAKSRPKPKK